MDKEAFLNQLEYAVTNNDKKLFVDTVFDLPADMIVGFTEEECSQIFSISKLVDLQQVEELFYFLENEGFFFSKSTLEGFDELNYFLLGRFYYGLLFSLAGDHINKFVFALIYYANDCCKLSEMGIESEDNLQKALSFYKKAQQIFPQCSPDYAGTLINEGNARKALANRGVASIDNLDKAILLYKKAQQILFVSPMDYLGEYAGAFMNEGNARNKLAEMGIATKDNLDKALLLYEKAILLYEKAQQILPHTNLGLCYAQALNNEGSTKKVLAEMGVATKNNLEEAVLLYERAQQILPVSSMDYAGSLMNEGSARSKLAELGVASKDNLEKAVLLYEKAQQIFPKSSMSYASALMNEGLAKQSLYDIGFGSIATLETGLLLNHEARKIFPQKSIDYARSLMNESIIRIRLAESGVESRDNLEKAILFNCESRDIFSQSSIDYARSLMNEGSARSGIVKLGIETEEEYEKSRKCYVRSISILENLEDGWTYSIALLRLSNLLIGNFYKTGDKKHLEEWEKNLGDIEEKIKERDIRYKQLVMARIHEIRASLLELDGKQGISNASFEYYKAYELSKEPFYKFMTEFCQARSDNKSFCKIVSDWKEGEKKGIFLDYYDYTVFECHLENALKKSIFRKDELELARQKLEEIGSRTQIKIIKDRVSAYVFLINSLDFCFEQGSYEDAAENVRKACKIFHEFDDKPGYEMCECFHEALLDNQNLESWRNIAQKIFLSGEFSSNFYRLLCTYSDRQRNILGNLSFKILENTSRIEGKVDNIQKTLDQISADCGSIKDQIEEGFEGTAAELRQVKEKINNTQQDLDKLVLISKSVGDKEGECIRRFASLMLELMKKGDYEALKRFSEKIVQNSSSIEEIVEAAEIPEKEKAEAKSRLDDLKKMSEILKKTTKSSIGDVTKNVIANLISCEITDGETIKIVSLASGEIIKLLIPVLSTAILGVPIPSKIVEILLEAIRNS